MFILTVRIMKTVRQLIEYLRNTADDLEERLEYEEITDELYNQANTYGIGFPFLATYNGFIDLANPSKEKEEE